MLPFRHVGGHNPGQWLGLIDAVYGIAMTLMIFDLPKTLKQIAIQYTIHPQYVRNQTFDFEARLLSVRKTLIERAITWQGPSSRGELSSQARQSSGLGRAVSIQQRQGWK
ncbi:MAG: hypothetical protein EBZ76_05080 [Synechococcaceae bacterium WB9_2_170]|nr:hypothetical protein [Synechococcaceae bacterium WB9_2_170]